MQLKHVGCFNVKYDRTKNQTISTKNIKEQGCHPVQKPETITQLPRTWSDSPTKWLSHEAAGCLSFKSLMFTEWSQNHLASVVSKRSDTVNQQFPYILIYIYICPSISWLPPLSSNFSGQNTGHKRKQTVWGCFGRAQDAFWRNQLVYRPVHLLFHSSNKGHFNASLEWLRGRLKHFSYNANVEWINGRFMIF